MSDSFFRIEVAEQQARNVFGRTIVKPYRPGAYVAAASALLIGVVAVFFLIGTYTPHAQAKGKLVPASGMAVIASPATGYVRRVSVVEGSVTAMNQPLLLVVKARSSLSTEDEGEALSRQFVVRQRAAEASMASQVEAIAERGKALREQLAFARRERQTFNLQLDNVNTRIALLTKLGARYRELAERKYISELQLQERESDFLRSIDERQQLARQILAQEREIIQLGAQIDGLPNELRLLHSTYEVQQATTAQEKIDRVLGVEYLVRSPSAGRIASSVVRPGEAVTAGQTLMTILPADSPLQAELYVGSSTIGEVAPGQAVRLRYAAYPFLKYGQAIGSVASVSRVSMSRQELASKFDLVGTASEGDVYYRVTVSLQRQQVGLGTAMRPLLPGMAVEADLLGRRRRLFEWLLGPLASSARDG